MEILSQTGIRANLKAVGFRKNEGYKQKQCPVSALDCGSCAAKPAAASQIYRNIVPRRISVTLMATKSGKNKHSDSPAYKELYEAYPEAALLKESRKAANEKSRVPDFADEEELVKSLELQFETDMDLETTHHYEIMYLIHEDNVNEVEEVVSVVKDLKKMVQGQSKQSSQPQSRRRPTPTFQEILPEDDEILLSFMNAFKENIAEANRRELHPAKGHKSSLLLKSILH